MSDSALTRPDPGVVREVIPANPPASTVGKSAAGAASRISAVSRDGDSARRQQVIDAAAAVFARAGYHGVGTREIAARLGIKVSSLYFHFASKEQALEEVCLRGIAASIEMTGTALRIADDLPSRLRAFFACQRELLRSHSDYITVYIHERRHLPPTALARVNLELRRFRAQLDCVFAEAADRGQLHPTLTPRSASLITIGTVRNLTYLYTEGPLRDFDDFLAVAVATLIRGCVEDPASR